MKILNLAREVASWFNLNSEINTVHKPIQDDLIGDAWRDCEMCGCSTMSKKRFCANCIHKISPLCSVCKVRPGATSTGFKYCSTNCMRESNKPVVSSRFNVFSLKKKTGGGE